MDEKTRIMITYLVNEEFKYGFSYRELKEEYKRHINMSDTQFLHNLPSALHIACFICYIKELPTQIVLGDKGIIHELVHLLQHGDGDVISVKEIRKLFKKQLKLV